MLATVIDHMGSFLLRYVSGRSNVSEIVDRSTLWDCLLLNRSNIRWPESSPCSRVAPDHDGTLRNMVHEFHRNNLSGVGS